MQKILIILILLFLVCSLIAQAENREQEIAYFSPISHNINVFFTELGDNEKVYFSDEIQIAKEDIPYLQKFAFTLSKNFIVDEVLVDGITALVMGVDQYSSLYFKDKLSESEIEYIANNASIYEVELPYSDDLTGNLTVTIKYAITPNTASTSFEKTENGYNFLGDFFWYPRNLLTEKTNMKVRVNTLTKYEVQSSFLTDSIVEDNIRVTNLVATDSDLPINFTIKKR